jgi:O-methyltransferase
MLAPWLETTKRVARLTYKEVARLPQLVRCFAVQRRYRDFSMLHPSTYIINLMLYENLAPAVGCVVECGAWRGGMSAGIADVLPRRVHYLFDSFEGLPPPRGEVDGERAIDYARGEGPQYLDNCRAEKSKADEAMRMSAAKEYHLMAGWFNETLKHFKPPEPIAVLRLDGDWYDSTMESLTALFPYVMPSGLILIDDYYDWDGCARAIHDYLSREHCVEWIHNFRSVCYLVKGGSTWRGESTWRV